MLLLHAGVGMYVCGVAGMLLRLLLSGRCWPVEVLQVLQSVSIAGSVSSWAGVPSMQLAIARLRIGRPCVSRAEFMAIRFK